MFAHKISLIEQRSRLISKTVSAMIVFFALIPLLGCAKNTGILEILVWEDTNRDGFFRQGEGFLDGVTVELWVGDEMLRSHITDGAGQATFRNLDNTKTYVLKVYREGFLYTEKEVGSNGITSSVFDSGPNLGETSEIQVVGDENVQTYYAGLFSESASFTQIQPTATSEATIEVAGFAWLDANGDGIYQEDESGIGDIEVSLVKVGENQDEIVSTEITSGGGNFGFVLTSQQAESIENSKIYFVFSALKDHGFTYQDAEGNDDDLFDSDVNPANGFTEVQDLSLGYDFRSISAGYLPRQVSVIDELDDCTNLIGEPAACESGSMDVHEIVISGDGELTVTITVEALDESPSPQVILSVDLDGDAATGLVDPAVPDFGYDYLFVADFISKTIEFSHPVDAAGNITDLEMEASFAEGQENKIVVTFLYAPSEGRTCSENPDNPLCSVRLNGLLCGISTCDWFPTETAPGYYEYPLFPSTEVP